MTVAQWVPLVFQGLGFVGVFLGVCTWFLTSRTERMTQEQKRVFLTQHPRIAGFVDLLAGFGVNSPQIRRGVVLLAKGLRAPGVAALIEALPDEGDRITLTPAAPLAPVVPPSSAPTAPTPFPPGPPPAQLYTRPAIDGRHATSRDELPPEAVERVAIRRKGTPR